MQVDLNLQVKEVVTNAETPEEKENYACVDSGLQENMAKGTCFAGKTVVHSIPVFKHLMPTWFSVLITAGNYGCSIY